MNKIIVLGDICIDVNYYGNVYKISPEAPIPIFTIESKEEIPGMSGNVIKNLENAGNEVISYTKEKFFYPMTYKNRYFAGNHYLYRIDEDNKEILKESEQEMILEDISNLHKDAKAIILQDYNKGFFTEEFMMKIIESTPKDTILIADGHKSRNPDFYEQVDYLKLNEDEYAELSKKDDIFKIPKKALIITKGSKGAILKYPDKSNKHFDAHKVETIDVTGAGDTFVSWFTNEIAKGRSEEHAMTIASKAAAISVTHLGCYAPIFTEVYSIDSGIYS